MINRHQVFQLQFHRFNLFSLFIKKEKKVSQPIRKNVDVEHRLFSFPSVSMEENAPFLALLSLISRRLHLLHHHHRHHHLLVLLLLLHHLAYHPQNPINQIYRYHRVIEVNSPLVKANVVQFGVSHHLQQIHHRKRRISKNHFIHVEEWIKQIFTYSFTCVHFHQTNETLLECFTTNDALNGQSFNNIGVREIFLFFRKDHLIQY